jgi:hypothetical protein
VTEDSRNLELLVHRIQQQLAPTAEVLHDVYLPGRQSKTDRQIDVLVRQKIGQYEMRIVQCWTARITHAALMSTA